MPNLKIKGPIIPDAEALKLQRRVFAGPLVEWYRKVSRPLPWRVDWAKHKSPWHVWVSEIMLQQTVIKAVLPVYESFLKKYPSPRELAAASTEEIRLAVRGLGYYRRFDLLHKATRTLQNQSWHWPSSYKEWIELPGIGTYTAAAISSITLNAPHGVVDGNVERVMCRLLDLRCEPNLPHLKKAFQEIMDSWCQIYTPGDVNQGVMELGQTICTPTNPSCKICPLKKRCLSFKNESQSLAPSPKSKPEFKEVILGLTIFLKQGQVGLIRRGEAEKFLRGTRGFLTSYDNVSLDTSLGFIRHNITSHKITAHVHCERESHQTFKNSSEFIQWLPIEEVEENLVSNLDRKAWNLFLKRHKIHEPLPVGCIANSTSFSCISNQLKENQ